MIWKRHIDQLRPTEVSSQTPLTSVPPVNYEQRCVNNEQTNNDQFPQFVPRSDTEETGMRSEAPVRRYPLRNRRKPDWLEYH